MAKKSVLLEVNGAPMLMKLGFNGLVELEEAMGRPITEIANGEVQFADLRTMFHVALKSGGNKGLTSEETGDILDEVLEEHGFEYLTDKLTDLFNSVMGAKEKENFLDTKG